MVSKSRKRGGGEGTPTPSNTNTNTNRRGGSEENSSSRYESLRNQRIQENKERMQKLGIINLASKLKPQKTTPKSRIPPPPISSSPPRRSPRIKTMTPVNYSISNPRSKLSVPKSLEIRLPEGSKKEVYTEEHEKLLGGCKTPWVLSEDGVGEDGKRIYDSEKGETCHQCRQKTLGLHTRCSKCPLVKGQFCGDCLFTRYGENVLEVNQNPSWICPVCRDICNCSLCRKEKGWLPTGNLYRKVTKLGFKSVAHFLIHTYRDQNHLKDSVAETKIPNEEVVPMVPNEEGVPSGNEENEGLEPSTPSGTWIPVPDKHSDEFCDPLANELQEQEREVQSSESTQYFDADDGCGVECSSKVVDADDKLKEEEANMKYKK
ncbi:hypothetical protein Tsubulata_011081 [Turnera subulata]|uniref:Zinc-finger domain-containing protein n=1 Tax=Turnera subulata TaxID=218843 RepID=A0A9Q0J3W1_9ROSI|nr:hypothetical protein Tsubulata_011081 [Turnera subulata]